MESRTITVEGLRTRVLEESGDGATGDPILLVHGVGGWAENWRAVIGPLAASGRRVLALGRPRRPRKLLPRRVADHPRALRGSRALRRSLVPRVRPGAGPGPRPARRAPGPP